MTLEQYMWANREKQVALIELLSLGYEAGDQKLYSRLSDSIHKINEILSQVEFETHSFNGLEFKSFCVDLERGESGHVLLKNNSFVGYFFNKKDIAFFIEEFISFHLALHQAVKDVCLAHKITYVLGYDDVTIRTIDEQIISELKSKIKELCPSSLLHVSKSSTCTYIDNSGLPF